MHHEQASALGRLASAFLLGNRLALFIAALSMLVVFLGGAQAYFSAIMGRRDPEPAAQLGAGIWLTAGGIVLGDCVRLALETIWSGDFLGFPLGDAMLAAGIFVIIAGYALHFISWARVSHPVFRRLSFYWLLGIALVIGAGVFWALGLG